MRTIASIVFGFVVIVIGLSIYLAPDDLAKCPKGPTMTSPCVAADAIVAVSGGDTQARTDEAIRLLDIGDRVPPRLLGIAWHRDRMRTRAADAFVDSAKALCERFEHEAAAA